MNIGYCKDCNNWNSPHPSYGMCPIFVKKDTVPPSGEAYIESAGELTEVCTAPDFGCLKFEEKR